MSGPTARQIKDKLESLEGDDRLDASAIKGGVGGSDFDPTAPGPIGGTTPAAGTFTDLRSSTLNVESRVYIDPNGNISIGSGGRIAFSLLSSAGFDDTILQRDGAGVFAQRDGANPQVSRIYNTFTDATTFERLNLGWDSNVAIIGTEKGSVGGTARALELQTDGTTRLTISPTGDASVANSLFVGGVVDGNFVRSTGGGFSFFGGSSITMPAGDGTFKLANNAGTDFNRIQLGGTTSSFPAIKRNGAGLEARLADDSGYAGFTAAAGTFTTLNASGLISAQAGITIPNGQFILLQEVTVQGNSVRVNNGVNEADVVASGPRIGSSGWLEFSDFVVPSSGGGAGVRLYREGGGILAQRNGLNSQALRIYNYWVDDTTREDIVIGWNSNTAVIGTEKGSLGGAARGLELQTDGTARITIQANGSIVLGSVVQIYQNGTTDNLCWDVAGSNSFRNSILVGSTGDSVVKLGGTTSSFPAIKRNGADIEIVGADGTAVGASNLILNSPDGSKFRITVTDGGVLTTTEI